MILSNRHYSAGDPGQRFLGGSDEGAAALQAGGRGAVQGAERETFLQSAAGLHVQVRLPGLSDQTPETSPTIFGRHFSR